MWKKTVETSDIDRPSPGPKGRQRRHWGPFSGGQLTAIILGLVLAVACPIGAYAAVTGSNVFVTDATSGTRAGVTTEGKVKVETGLNSLYGLVPTIVGGGTVNAPTASPSDMYSATRSVGASSEPIASPPTGKTLVVQHLTIDWYDETPGLFVNLQIDAPTCPSGAATVQRYDLPPGPDFRTVPFVPGLVIPAGKSLCAYKGGGIFGASLHVTGYNVPQR